MPHQSINAAIKKLRKALGDSADEPTYIRTVSKQGYRLIPSVEKIGGNGNAAEPAVDQSTSATRISQGRRTRRSWLLAGSLLCLAVVGTWLSRHSHASPKLKKQDTIVIAEFDNKTGDSVFDDTALTLPVAAPHTGSPGTLGFLFITSVVALIAITAMIVAGLCSRGTQRLSLVMCGFITALTFLLGAVGHFGS